MKEKPGKSSSKTQIEVIYNSEEGDILYHYIDCSKVFTEQYKLYGKSQKTIDETLRICRDKKVFSDYLKREKVAAIMYQFMDQEAAMKKALRTERQEGRQEGKQEGKIIGTVETMRDDEKDDQAIIARLIKKYGLTQKEAERYVLPAALAEV